MKIRGIARDDEIETRICRAGNLHVVFKGIAWQRPRLLEEGRIYGKQTERSENSVYGDESRQNSSLAPDDVEECR